MHFPYVNTTTTSRVRFLVPLLISKILLATPFNPKCPKKIAPAPSREYMLTYFLGNGNIFSLGDGSIYLLGGMRRNLWGDEYPYPPWICTPSRYCHALLYNIYTRSRLPKIICAYVRKTKICLKMGVPENPFPRRCNFKTSVTVYLGNV